MGRNFRGFGDDGGVDVFQHRAAFFEQEADFPEKDEAADAAPAFVGVGEVMADVARAERAEDGVGEGVDEDVGVGVALEALVVRQLNAAEKKFAPLDEGVDVITNADAIHKNRLACPESGATTSQDDKPASFPLVLSGDSA